MSHLSWNKGFPCSSVRQGCGPSVIRLTSFLWLWFSVCLPSDAFLQHLLSYLGFFYLRRGVSLMAAPAKCSHCSLPWMRGISYLTFQVTLLSILSVLQINTEHHTKNLRSKAREDIPLPSQSFSLAREANWGLGNISDVKIKMCKEYCRNRDGEPWSKHL